MYRRIAADVSHQLRKQGFTPGAPYLEKLIAAYEGMRLEGPPKIASIVKKMRDIRPDFRIARDTVIDALVLYNERRIEEKDAPECLYHLGGGNYTDRLAGSCIYDD